jgi:hypothetical protein
MVSIVMDYDESLYKEKKLIENKIIFGGRLLKVKMILFGCEIKRE